MICALMLAILPALAPGCSTGSTNAGPPTQPSDEPIFSAAAGHFTIFHDGFEAYSSALQLKTWESVFPRRWLEDDAVGLSLETTGAQTGTKSARFTYPASTSQQDQLIGAYPDPTTVNEDPSVVVLTFWLKSSPGHPWYGGHGQNAHKIFVLNAGGGQANRILLQFARDGIAPAPLAACNASMAGVGTPTWSIAGALFKQNRNYPAWGIRTHANDGKWHRYTTRFTKSTLRPAADFGNGRIEMWVDGVKVLEYLGDDPNRCEYRLVNVPTGKLIGDFHFPSVDGAVGELTWLEYDEIRVWRP